MEYRPHSSIPSGLRLATNFPRMAVASILDNVILHLQRYDFEKAAAMAELLLRDDTLWRISTPMDVVRTAILRDAFSRGVAQIKRNAPSTAIAEFKRARRIWELSLGDARPKMARAAVAETNAIAAIA